MSTFAGFSEEDLKRIKLGENGPNSEPQIMPNLKKAELSVKHRKISPQYKLPTLQKQDSDDAMQTMFEQAKLSIKSTSTPVDNLDITAGNGWEDTELKEDDDEDLFNERPPKIELQDDSDRKNSFDTNTIIAREVRSIIDVVTPDIVRGVENYTEDDIQAHKAKMGELQLKQKLMEEQNKKRKEMLAKALADRTRKTEEEVLRLEKIKKELQVLDGQFSHDVGVLRKKIDQACLTYADAEKHYLKVEKEFLQAKISLQKEKEKKELLTEHLCALITHNETRKAQKLETLMLELATEKRAAGGDVTDKLHDDKPVIIDGVDERTGKMVEMSPDV